MWKDPKGDLDTFVKVSNTLQIESLVIAEWNMNDFAELYDYGSYRFRPSASASQFFRAPLNYDNLDTGSFYRNSEKSFFTFSDFVTDTDEPVLFESEEVDRQLYFNLKDCFSSPRPRSGINKALYFENKYIDNVKTARRPRYYMSSRYDTFKYWNSYRTQVENEEIIELGVSTISNPTGFTNDIGYFIDDVAPFVVYKDSIPTNRIVVKMQTNLADSTSTFNIRTSSDEEIVDPLQDRSKSSIPQRWRIEYLDELDNWITAARFDENSTRRDSTEIVKWDGYVELYYGLRIPESYKESFNFIDYIDDESGLGFLRNRNGDAYIVGASDTDPGILYIWNESSLDWESQPVEYGYSLLEDDDTKRLGIVTKLTNPEYFRDTDNKIVYREFSIIKGLRLVVETMIAPETTFDLIELSPRLTSDISRYIMDYSFSKSIANDQLGIPVGGLLASNGNLNILNDDGTFTEKNIFRYENENDAALAVTPKIGSLVAQYLKPNIKFTFYEAILNVNGYDKFIPMKTMYAEEFSGSSGGESLVSIPIRDLFFRIEEYRAPSMFLTSTTLTSAVAMLLDNIGFSNYVFKGFDKIIQSNGGTVYPDEYPPTPDSLVSVGGNPYFDETTGKLIPLEDAWEKYWDDNGGREKQQEYLSSFKDTVIPYFFVSPDSSTAQVLADLALSCQAAMFFDEYNNLVVMPKEYIMPEPDQRVSDTTIYGQVKRNSNNQVISLPNIAQVQSYQTTIINDGIIQYNVRYIQRQVSSFSQLTISTLDEDRDYGYQPVLLWEVGGNAEQKTKNEQSKETSSYTLGAAVLNTNLSASVPYVENNEIKNNIIDIGENVYWLPRFQSYLFANGEIIRYDAIEYEISGTGKRWITNNLEYQKYFGSLPFNGKIYPTGNLRIFVEPYYVEYDNAPNVEGLLPNVTYKNGEVKRHGRGQFGTEIVEHYAGLPEYWSSNDNVRGLNMDSKYIFSTTPTANISYPSLTVGSTPVGQNNALAQKSDRTGVIRNFFRKNYPTDNIVRDLRVTQSGTMQSSALSFYGPAEMDSGVTKRDFITYVYKNLNSAFKHFGTRMRVIGELKANDKVQAPSNSTTYFNVQPNDSSDSVNIDGSSGGIAIGINPSTNHGYFFEICPLTKDNLQEYFTVNEDTGQQESVLHNIIFYKTMRSGDTAVPQKLWGGLAKIIVDPGIFVGMDRVVPEDITVYDLAVEYENIGNTRRFYLYINNAQVAIVDDANPLPEYTNVALFVRGSSHCMFENVYALQNLMAKNTGTTVASQLSDSFAIDKISSSDSIAKYNVSGFIRSSYLTDISAQHEPRFKIYFEEFGTIFRECAYFNIRYDQAYPALIAKIAETFGQDRGYTVSGFYAGSYGAEFLVFNNTDRQLLLDETTGRYLRIIGVTFTQDVTEDLTVDEFFKERSNFSDPFIVENSIKSPIVADKIFDDIKESRRKYGKKEFNINPIYIQSYDDASDLMEWLIGKTLRPRKNIVVNVFGTPQIQLGDLVNIDYVLPEGVDFVDPDKQFVVYSIDHSRDQTGMSTVLGLVEV